MTYALQAGHQGRQVQPEEPRPGSAVGHRGDCSPGGSSGRFFGTQLYHHSLNESGRHDERKWREGLI